MDKSVRACSIENEAESEILCSILNEQAIPYILKKTEDAAYDGLYIAQGPWGFIETPLEYVDSVVQILRDVRGSRVNADLPGRGASPHRKRRMWLMLDVGIPVVLLIALAILLTSYIRLRQNFDRHASQQTAIQWNWVPSERAMVGKIRSTGQLRYKDYDRNLNNIYEEDQIYSPDQKRITTYYDDNEDGWKEHYELRTVDGRLISKYEDQNQNGVFEHSTYFYSETQYVEYFDKDDDGLDDVAVVHDGGQTRTIDLRKILFTGQP